MTLSVLVFELCWKKMLNKTPPDICGARYHAHPYKLSTTVPSSILNVTEPGSPSVFYVWGSKVTL